MVTLGEKEIAHNLNDPQEVQEPKAHVVAQMSKGSGYSEHPLRSPRAPKLQVHGTLTTPSSNIPGRTIGPQISDRYTSLT